MLSSVAGIVGLAAGGVLVRAIRVTAPVDVPRIEQAALDGRVLLFTFAVTLGCGVLIGLVPAWRATRTNAAELLRSSSATAMSSRASGGLRSLLVSVEVAASAVCLIAGALIVSSFVQLLSADRGFEGDRVVTAEVVLAPPRYDAATGLRFLTSVTERVRALPGVTSAGVTDVLPLSGVSSSAIMVEGTTLPRPQRPAAMLRVADRGYFDTLGIRPIAGRLLDDRDRGVAVITARTARQLWPGENPLGKRFRHGPDDSPWVEVVGVVNDVRAVSLSEDPPLSIYRPAADYFYGLAALAVKTTSDPTAVVPAIQRILREMDAELVVPTPRTMEEIVAASVAQPRFQMRLVILLAAAAAFLAALGIYGVVSQSVVQRSGEFGIRMALGAASGNILRLVMRRAMLPVVVGLALGIAAALGAGQFLRAILFGVSPTDVTAFAVASLFLIAIALLASVIPAYRATRVNPLEAIRAE